MRIKDLKMKPLELIRWDRKDKPVQEKSVAAEKSTTRVQLPFPAVLEGKKTLEVDKAVLIKRHEGFYYKNTERWKSRGR